MEKKYITDYQNKTKEINEKITSYADKYQELMDQVDEIELGQEEKKTKGKSEEEKRNKLKEEMDKKVKNQSIKLTQITPTYHIYTPHTTPKINQKDFV